MPETTEELRAVLETLLFITDHPLSLAEIAKIAGVKPEEAEPVLKAIQQDFEQAGRPEQVLEVAEGYQMATRQKFAAYVRKLYTDRLSFRLSQAALETLSIIAYKQPITRAEIEELRGVEVIAALETLLEKRLVKVAGRKEVVGRPLLYGTTLEFLRHFGLKSLEELPNLDSFAPPPAAEGGAPAAGGETLAAVSAPVGAAIEETPAAEGAPVEAPAEATTAVMEAPAEAQPEAQAAPEPETPTEEPPTQPE